MNTLANLCLDLFLLGHAHIAAGQAGQGAQFERRVRAHLNMTGLAKGPGFRVFGRRSQSGIYHQIDEQTACDDAMVVGEWKAYGGQIPKNELLRFKAVTDDYWLSQPHRRSMPVARVFGGTGTVTESMRAYAAQWGIILITPRTWPIPTLCDENLLWSLGDIAAPGRLDQLTLRSLIRPLHEVLLSQADGSFRIPLTINSYAMLMRLGVWDRWSDDAWNWWDAPGQGRFDRLLESRLDSSNFFAA
jgi:hypothetical protein